MSFNVIITGSTGMVGRSVLNACLDHPEVAKILLINRKSLGIEHKKLEEMILPDFFRIDSLDSKFRGYDACFYCLGISSAGMAEPDYRHITYDMTIRFASTFLKQAPAGIFCYISGAGTDSSEKGKTMWARVKGETENALLAMPFKAVYMFRPGFIQPEKGVRSRTPLYNLIYTIMRPFFPLLRRFPSWVTTSGILGQAMIRVVLEEPDQRVFESIDINQIGKK